MARCVRFLSFELNANAGELRGASGVVPLSRQQFLLLTYLCRERKRVVGRDELSLAVWEGTRVGDGSLRQAVSELRKLLGDDPDRPGIIQTLRGRGYRFVAPVQEVEGPPEVAGTTEAGSSRGPHALVGREGELALLREERAAALVGAGRAVLIFGPAGVGKSRLAHALIDECASALQLQVRCYREADAPPLFLWGQLLGDFAGSLPGDQGALFRERASAIGPVDTAAQLAAPSARSGNDHRLFAIAEEVHRLLRGMSEVRPAVLWIDDVQWADAVSLAVLKHVVSRIGPSRILLLLTARPKGSAEQERLQGLCDVLSRGPLNRQLELQSLSPTGLAALLRGHHLRDDPQFVEEVYRLTAGNPLFSLEVARHAESGAQLQIGADHAPAPGLVQVIRHRLAQLPGSTRRVIAAASVLGGEFSLAALGVVLECEPAGLLPAVEDAGAAAVFAERSPLCFHFAHPLFGEVAYAELAHSERVRLHRLAGQALETQYPEPSGTVLHALARHFYHAAPEGEAARAVKYAIRCAESAVRSAAFADAGRYYGLAVECCDLLPQADPALRLAMQLGLSEAERAESDTSEALSERFLELARQARTLNAPELFGRAVLGYLGHMQIRFQPLSFAMDTDPMGEALLEEALSIQTEVPSGLKVFLRASLAYVKMTLGHEEERNSLVALAEADAYEVGDAGLMARAMALRFYIASNPLDTAGQVAMVELWVEHTERHGLKELEVEARIALVYCLLCQGDRVRAERAAARANYLADRLGSDSVRAWVSQWPMWKALLAGDFEQAAQCAELGASLAGEDPNNMLYYAAIQSYIDLVRGGDWAQVAAMNEMAAEAFPRFTSARATLAAAYAALGRREEALAEFDAVLTMESPALSWLMDMAALTDAAWLLRCPDRCAKLYERLLPLAGDFVFLGFQAIPGVPVDHMLSLCQIVCGDFEAATRHLQAAEQVASRLQATFAQQLNQIAAIELFLAAEAQFPIARPDERAELVPRDSSEARTMTERLLNYARRTRVRLLENMALDLLNRIRVRAELAPRGAQVMQLNGLR